MMAPSAPAADNESPAGATATDERSQQQQPPIVQYIIVRTDLGWGTGPLIAQACHASVAATVATLANQSTKLYLADLENMHKVILRADKLDDLTRIETELKQANIDCTLWVEKPENIATCLAVSPQPKQLVQAFFKHLKLFK